MGGDVRGAGGLLNLRRRRYGGTFGALRRRHPQVCGC